MDQRKTGQQGSNLFREGYESEEVCHDTSLASDVACGSRPKISDDDLLGLIEECGRICDLAVLHRTLTEQMDDVVDLDYLLTRLDRLYQIGALRILEPSADGILQFELTERGVYRREATVRACHWSKGGLPEFERFMSERDSQPVELSEEFMRRQGRSNQGG
jgi:hypothetical protein